MPYAFFYEHCPQLAEDETRTITISQNSSLGIPAGEYALVEMFCNERKCDCRRVFFYVISRHTNEPVAVIAYGWESKKFYAKWMRDDDPEVIEQLQGPNLNLGSPQSSIAPAILDIVNDMILNDKAFVERIKTHYLIYRAKIERLSSSRRKKRKPKSKR